MKKEERVVSKHYVNQREKRIAMVYVSVCFIVLFSITGFFFLKNNSSSRIFGRKEKLVSRMENIERFKELQTMAALQCDTLYAGIKKFKPNVYASYEENDIRYELNDLKGIYLKNSWDRRYKMFEQISTLYDMWLTDRKELWCQKENLRDFTINLQDCEMGVRELKKN
ncbi:type VI secretion system transmembrane protein TssO [Marinilabilia salmonicolor]|uniref:type VI secretion system transmembrane protein TssO n=1 Tax=Marinilabilia salmonicolor TaxID=989 RepID=UPI00029AAAE1|nr:type VI secretion system transmembrane protein TssO [Marinilabilia salmonicolor]